MTPNYRPGPIDWLKCKGGRFIGGITVASTVLATIPKSWQYSKFMTYLVTAVVVYFLIELVQRRQMEPWLQRGIKDGKRLQFGASNTELLDYQSYYGCALVIAQKYLGSYGRLLTVRRELEAVMAGLPEPQLDELAHRV